MTTTNRNDIDLRRLWRSIRSLWWLYAACGILIVGAGVLYCATASPAYESHALIMIEDNSSDVVNNGGSMAAMMRTFSVGGFASSSVDNEIILIGSHDVLLRTVKRLGLNRTYTSADDMKHKVLFDNSPVTLEAPEEFFDTLTHPFAVDVRIHSGKADIKATTGRWFKKTIAEAKAVELPYVLSTPYGPISILHTPGISENYSGTVRIDVCGNEAAQAQLYKDVQINISNKMADAISLDISDKEPVRARAILNTIMDEYNAKRLGRKHDTAIEEVRFYDERIAELFANLTESEAKIEKYQTDNRMAGIYAEAEALVKNSVSTKNEIARQQAQIVYLEQVLDALRRDNNDDLLPYVMEWSTPQIEEYNKAIIDRKNLARSAKEGNRLLQHSDNVIHDLRESIKDNITEVLTGAREKLKAMYGITGAAASRLNTLPHHEREFITLNRDKNMKNELYLFLMQKRENAALEASSTATLGFVVDEAYTDVRPSRKKYIMVICASLLLALLIPTSAAVARTIVNDRVYEPVDMAAAGLEKSTIVCGEDPSDINRLRTLILAHKSVHRIYVAALGDAVFPTEALAGSLRNAGLTVSVETGEADNDSLLHKSPGPDYPVYTISSIPDPNRIGELLPVLSEPDAMLAVAIPRGGVTRRRMRLLASELGNTYFATVIVKSDR